MEGFTGEELGRIVHFAEGGNDAAARNRLQKRLAQTRNPSSRTQSSAWVNWNNMAEVLGQPFDSTRIPISKLEQMRRDPMLSFGLTYVKVPLVRAPWYIKSSDPQRASFVDNALRRIYGRLILAYTNCFDFGFSAMIKRFEYIQPDWTYIDKGADGATPTEKDVWPDKGVNALVWKPPLALGPRAASPHWNADGEFAGIDFAPGGGIGAFGSSGSAGYPWEQGGSGSGGGNNRVADIPLDWALWATNEKDSVFGSFWGYPRIGYAYRYWWSYWYKFGLADRAFEKWADPPVVIFHPSETGLDADGNQVDFGEAALAVAEQLRSGANVAMPSAVIRGLDDRATHIREWYHETFKSEANFEALNKNFEYLDAMKLRSVMVPEQALIEGAGGTSSRNVAATMGDVFQESQAIVMQEIDDMINSYMIPQLLEANFGPGGAPCTKVTTGFDPQDLDTMSAVVQVVANNSPSLLPIDFRETLTRLGVPLLSQPEYKKVLDEAAKQAALLKPPVVSAKTSPSGSKTAGVTKTGLYYLDGDDVLHMEDDGKGTLRRIFDRLVGVDEVEPESE